MGWSFAYNPAFDKKAQVEMFRRPGFLSEGYVMLKSSVIGNNFWFLYQRPDNSISIGLNLMKGGGRGSGWGYKGLSEDCGPVEVNCPKHYLRHVTAPQSQYAAEWRAKVQEYHASRLARPKPQAGMVVEYGGRRFRLEGVNWKGPRYGWDVLDLEDGFRYRMRAHQLKNSRICKCDTKSSSETSAQP